MMLSGALAGALGAASTALAIDPNRFPFKLADTQIPLQFQVRNHSSHSPPHYPSPWMNPDAPGWQEAYAKARAFVSQMTLIEKVNLTTGIGLVTWMCANGKGAPSLYISA